MIKRRTLREWANAIDELQKDLHTGAGVLFSTKYSKENNELYDAAESLKKLLTIYYNYETLSKEQLFRINQLSENVSKKAIAYMKAKEKAYNETIEDYAGENKDKKLFTKPFVAKKDKTLRFNAAKGLMLLTANAHYKKTKNNLGSIYNTIKGAADEYPDKLDKLPEYYQSIETTLGDVKEVSSADGIIKNLNEYLKDHSGEYGAYTLRLKAVGIRNEHNKAHKDSVTSDLDDISLNLREGRQNPYDPKTAPVRLRPKAQDVTYGDLAKKFRAIDKLHRLKLLTYDSPDDFLKIYKKRRLQISEVIDIYKWASELKASQFKAEREAFDEFLESVPIDESEFDNLSEKIIILDLISQHMDAQMNICTNPESARLSMDDLKELQTKAGSFGNDYKEYLESQKTKPDPNHPNEKVKDNDKVKLIKSYHKIAKLKKLGIEQFKNTVYKKEDAVINNTVTRDGVTRTFKFLDAQARAGRKAAGATLITGDIDAPAFVKAKVAKFSAKYRSEHGHFMIGAHAGTGGALVGGTASAGFSIKNPLDANAMITTTDESYAARGVAKMFVGNNDFNIISKTTSNVLHTQASGTAAVGHVTKTDANGNVELDGYGFSFKGGATASVWNASSWNAITIFGVRISLEWSVKGAAIGAEGDFSFVANQGMRIGAGGALGLGGSLYLSIDWRNVVDRFKRWRKRKAVTKTVLEAKEQQKENKKLNAELKDNIIDDNSIDNKMINNDSQAHLRTESTDSLFDNPLNEAIDKAQAKPKPKAKKPHL